MQTKPKNDESWPEVLKAFRSRRGLTQKAAAELLGVPIITYRKWEQGRANPIFRSPEAAKEILCSLDATAFSVEPDATKPPSQ